MKNKLLFHICCGPCSIAVVEKLSRDYDLTLFFYNPNIYPEKEYQKRFNELKRWARQAELKIIEGPFDQDNWFLKVKGLEDQPEGGARCAVCFRIRLEEAARFAQGWGFDCLATSLTSGRNKKASVINPIGEAVCQKHGLEFVAGDWKKDGGQEESVRLSKQQDFYRQNYCGCKFSIRD